MELQKSEKILFGIAAFIITAFSAFGFYLIQGKPKIASLAAAGHNHVLSFAYGAILFGFLLRFLMVPERRKLALAWWMSLTYLGPIALIWAGLTGNSAFLKYTSPVFEGSFAILWLILFWMLLRQKAR